MASSPDLHTPPADKHANAEAFDFSSSTNNGPSRRLSSSVLSLHKHLWSSKSSSSVARASKFHAPFRHNSNNNSNNNQSNDTPTDVQPSQQLYQKQLQEEQQRLQNLGLNDTKQPRPQPNFNGLAGTATPPRSPTKTMSREDIESSYGAAVPDKVTDDTIPEEGEEEDAEDSRPQSGFPFVRALHSFDSSTLTANDSKNSTDDPASICLSFEEGDIALLHSVHSSGWGDATIISSGARGWIPTNYFVAYNDPKIAPLLTAILAFVAQPMSFELAPGVFSFSQEAVTNIVAGVRSLLEACGTLTRDTPTVKKSQAIRKFRKNLLAELAILVSLAKQHRNSTDESVIERLVNGCYKIAAKAAVFLDVWAVDSNTPEKEPDYVAGNPLRPLAQRQDSVETMSTRNNGGQSSPTSMGPPQAPQTQSQAQSQAKSVPTATGSQTTSDSTPTPAAVPRTVQPKPSFTTNRESVIFHTQPPMAKQRLEEVNEALLSYLGVFIHRMKYLEQDPTASTQILVNTRKSMLGCRELLAVVESVSSKQQPRSRELEQTKDKLFGQIRSLVTSARDVVASSSKSGQSANNSATPKEGTETASDAANKLIESATICARTAGECVVRCRLILESVGDFQMSGAREYPDFSDGVAAVPSYQRSAYSFAGSVSSPLSPTFPTHTMESKIPEDQVQESSNQESIDNPAATKDSGSDDKDDQETLKSGSRPASVASALSEKAPEVVDESAYPVEKQIIVDGESGRVRGGSLQAWINMMTDETKEDNPFMLSTFFLTFRLFSTPREVIDCAINRYALEIDEETLGLQDLEDITARRVKVFHFVRRWLESHWKQSVDGEVLEDILSLADHHFVKILPNAKTIVHELANQLTSPDLEDGEPLVPRLVARPDGSLPRSSVNPRSVMPNLQQVPTLPSKSQLHMLQRNNEYYGYKGWNSSDPLAPIDEEEASTEEPTSPVRSRKSSIIPNSFHNDQDARSVASSTWSSSFRIMRNSTFNSSSSGLPSTISVLDFEPLELAAQLTLMDSDMFCKLEPAELISRNFDKKRGMGQSPRVGMMASYMNQFSSFVGNTVLQSDLPLKQRKNVLKFWIKVADKCADLRNYNSLIGIMSVLQGVNIIRLKRTWESLSPRYHAVFNKLKEISTPERNFAAYRQKIRTQHAPCVPFLGVYLTDLTFLVEGNVKKRKFSIPGAETKVIPVINYDLYERIAKLIGEIQKFQVPYKMPACKELQSWIRGEMVRAHEEVSRGDELWRRSCIVEPKN